MRPKLNLKGVKEISLQLKKKLTNNFITNVSVINSSDVVFMFSFIKEKLLISLNHNTPFVSLTNLLDNYNTTLGNLNDNLRKYLKNCYVIDVNQLNNDRVIEFSLVNDCFRICGYYEDEDRFIKMNLDSMHNIEMTEKTADFDLLEAYSSFIRRETKTVALDVEPIEHVIDRCFRVFSCYDRKARYNKAEKKYRLEISYFRPDENEIIKNILSLGSYVVVMEPRAIQKKVYKRIQAANELYE